MSEPLTQTSFDDAPLATAHNPDATAYGWAKAQRGDTVIARTVTIRKPRLELYAFWRDFRNLPRFMRHISSVTVQDDSHSHWVVAAPGGKTVEWDAVITEEIVGASITWQSTQSAGVRNSGRVVFRDARAGRGTEVTATVVYDQPAGALGKLVGKLLQTDPKTQLHEDLRRFKQLMETGEVSTAQPPSAAPRA